MAKPYCLVPVCTHWSLFVYFAAQDGPAASPFLAHELIQHALHAFRLPCPPAITNLEGPVIEVGKFSNELLAILYVEV